MRRKSRVLLAVTAAGCLLMLASCTHGSSVGISAETAAPTAGAPPAKKTPAVAGAAPKSKIPTKPAKTPTFVAIQQLVVRHKDSRGGRDQRPDRTREEAHKRAAEALARARRSDVDFRDVIAKYSDDAARQRDPAHRDRATLYQELDRKTKFREKFAPLGEAIFTTEEGQVSDVVETPFGFHILMRVPIVEYAASQIVVQYKGAENSTRTRLDGETGNTITEDKTDRTREEAKALAEELTGKLKRQEETFEELAHTYSDDGSPKERGGYIGIFLAGWITPELEEALDKIKVGEVTGPIETPFGFHTLRREKVKRIRVSNIKVTYKGAKRYPRKVTRSREEAKQYIQRVYEQLKSGADFAALARDYSDQNQETGGDWGFLGPKMIPVPEVEEAAWKLKVGETSDIIDAEHGFYVIKRTE